MSAFVESCVETVAGKAQIAERRRRGQPRVCRLLRLLADKKKILITSHEHPDPDAYGSVLGMLELLRYSLPEANIQVSLKGRVGGGINSSFYRESSVHLVPWEEQKLSRYDAIILLDTQPLFAYSPLPKDIIPLAVIDHHRTPRGKKPKSKFCDIRTEVGAAASIVFSYFMELDIPISSDLAATMLYAIESDLAGSAGNPTGLDNIALSSLTLKADPARLHRIRYVDLPRSYYVAFAQGIENAMFYDHVLISHLDEIDSLEKPAVLADFLLRFDQADWVLVSALYEKKMILSLRTSSAKASAGILMNRLLKKLGEGGGHRTKAGGTIILDNPSTREVERVRNILRKRLLRLLKSHAATGQKLVPGKA